MEQKQPNNAVLFVLTAFFLFVLYLIATTKKRPENGYIKEISNRELNRIEGVKYLNPYRPNNARCSSSVN